MGRKTKNAFDHVQRTVGGHFVISLYAGIYRLLNQIRRLHVVGGDSLETFFNRLPFLADYFNEMREHMPEDIHWEDATEWWHMQLEVWTEECETPLPLSRMADEAGLSFASTLAFMVTGLVEEDSRFATLYAELQQPLTHRRPTLELVGQMMIDDAMVGEADPWSICRPLIEMGYLEAENRHAPRSEWVLKVPPVLWDAARGDVDREPAHWCSYRERAALRGMSDLIVDDSLRQKLSKLPDLVHANMTRLVILRAVPGTDTHELMGAIAHSQGRGLVAVDQKETGNEAVRALGPLCTMSHAMPVLSYDLAPGETVEPPKLHGYGGPVGIVMGFEGGLGSHVTEKAVTLTIPTPDIGLRKRFWAQSFKSGDFESLDDISKRFRLPGGYIKQAAETALANAGLEGREEVCVEDIRVASRTLNHQMLDTLASHMETGGSWGDLVSGESTSSKLMELQQRCRYREELLGYLGRAFRSGQTCGVRALFTGASGTGKTLAAKILAAEMGMDLYRVDLAAVINKYIGETEKNLHRVLSRAEALDVVLLLDEGDALLGSRTEVKSANDRYANLETNYLLQRLEVYQGVVLITTNLVENIDRAFQRRMDVVVPFFQPQAEERLQILDLHLPDDHEVDQDYMMLVARRCALNGGQLKNAALHATLFALDGRGPLRPIHLEEGLRSEYRKSGATFPLEAVRDIREHDGGMQTFLGALGGRG